MLEYKPLNAARECGVTFFYNTRRTGDPSCMLLRQRQQGYEIFSQHRIVHFGDGHWIKLFSRSAAINCHLYVSNGSVLGVKSE
jgi:hypothetical protein